MAFSGGVYTLPTPALVPGQIVSSSENNTVRNDMAASFNLTWLRNGTAAATANIPMGSFKLTGLGAATTSGDALSYGAAAVVTTLTSTSLTATRVPYAGTGGLLQDASTFTFNGTTLTAGGFTTSGAISAGTITASGAITVSGGTANGVAYLNGSKVLTTGSALTFDGTVFANTAGGITATSSSIIVGSANANKTLYLANYANTSGNWNTIYSSSGLLNVFANTTDNLAFGANGTEQMRLTSTGLGIGTSSPSRKLTISGGGQAFSDAGGADRTIAWGDSSTGIYPVSISGFGTTGALAFNTAAFGSSGTERMRLDSSGNLGLGVTPKGWDAGWSAIDFGGNSIVSGNSTMSVALNAYRAGSNWIYKNTAAASNYYQSSGAHYWYTAPSGTAGNLISFTQAMTLDASGNLGIGTSSPAVKFVVSNGGAGGIEIDPTGYISSYNRSTSANQDLYIRALQQYFYTNGSERMRIDSNGNVGIGTSSPTAGYKLTVAGGNIHLNNANGWITGNTSLSFYGDLASSSGMKLDSSGNLGLGVTPSAWSVRAIDVPNNYSFGHLGLSNNAYYNAGWLYKTTAAASLYQTINGAHYWNIAPSGIAGNAITFTQAMTLTAAGNLLNGTTSEVFTAGTGVSIYRASGAAIRLQDANTDFDILSFAGNVSLSNRSNGALISVTNNTERMRIDSSGNVGIGTSSPSTYGAQIVSYKSTGSFGYLGHSNSGTFPKVSAIGFGSDAVSHTYTSSGSSVTLYGSAQIAAIQSAASNAPTDLAFYTTSGGSVAERMRIDSSGNLLVGKTSAATSGEGLWLQSTTADGGRQNITRGNNTNTQTHLSFYTNAGTQVGTVNTTTTSTAYNTSSDYRLKENIQPMQNALATVAQLNPVTYTWKADGSDGQGFIAHELQAVVPDCVTGEKDAVDEEGKPVYQGIDTSFLVATLTKAIQELEARVKQLEGK